MAWPEEEREPPAPEWILTFADMMALLLTFFIMLASLGEIQSQDKLDALTDSIHRQFGRGVFHPPSGPAPCPPRDAAIAAMATRGRQSKREILLDGARPTTQKRLDGSPPRPM
ncbi:MAG: hypothetical protein FJ297_03185 [Planctomycetes bacterium]|nr:hypothetical protein [Planctomycetota bacterium]